jgi:hypothetical protein
VSFGVNQADYWANAEDEDLSSGANINSSAKNKQQNFFYISHRTKTKEK